MNKKTLAELGVPKDLCSDIPLADSGKELSDIIKGG